jgi:hypothetical protein
MNALVILNVGNFCLPKVRESFQDAANRWGVKYVEITEPLGPIGLHHFWQKALIPTSRHVAGFDRILQLDCDMLIRSDCPSPFDLVPETHFGAVTAVQRLGVPKWNRRTHRWAHRMGLTLYPRPRDHLNAGLLLYNLTAHAAMLREWPEVGRRCNWPGPPQLLVPEQFAISCLLHQMQVPVTWLPSTFDTTWAGRFSPGPMHKYVYHYTAAHGQLAGWVAHHDWRV